MVNNSPSLSQLIEQAIAGEPEAIRNVMQYLNAANPDLRKMMQGALHATDDERLWQRMLFCIGHECWPVLAEDGQTFQSPAQPAHSLYTLSNQSIVSRGLQSIVEVYVVDTGPSAERELELKLGVLLPALESPEALNRWAAAYVLGLRGNLRAVPVLDEIITTTCEVESALTAQKSGHAPAGGPRTKTPAEAEELSLDQCVRWQLRAVQALETLNDIACGPPLVKALANPQRVVHHAAGQALAELGRSAEPALLNALHFPDPHVRWHAARALGQIGDLRAIDTLAEGLYDDNQEVRWTTARVLANLDGPAIPAILQILVRHPVNEPLRQTAFHALNGMSGLHQPEIQAYLKPLLDELRRPSAAATSSTDAPMIAQRLLADWKNLAPLYTTPPAKREDRHLEFG
jgi:HEAT repeat protein